MVVKGITLDDLASEIKKSSIFEFDIGYFTTYDRLNKSSVKSHVYEIDTDDALSISDILDNPVYVFDFKKKKLRFISSDGVKIVNDDDKDFGIIYKIARNAFNIEKNDYDTMYG